jgi:hypothetical protein
MIDANHALPLGRQAQLLDLSRSSIYYRPQPTIQWHAAKAQFAIQFEDLIQFEDRFVMTRG